MPDTVRELVGVYDADGMLLGEARYWIGARLGRAHCALCDITHGLLTERADWRRCRDQLDVEFRTYHRNDAPADVRHVHEMGEVADQHPGRFHRPRLNGSPTRSCSVSSRCGNQG